MVGSLAGWLLFEKYKFELYARVGATVIVAIAAAATKSFMSPHLVCVCVSQFLFCYFIFFLFHVIFILAKIHSSAYERIENDAGALALHNQEVIAFLLFLSTVWTFVTVLLEILYAKCISYR